MAKDQNSKDAAATPDLGEQLKIQAARADAAEAALAEQTARGDAAEAALTEQTARADAAEAALELVGAELATQTARADAAEAALEGKKSEPAVVALPQGMYVLRQGAIMSGYLDHPHKEIRFESGRPVEVNPAGDSWFAAQVDRGYIVPFGAQ